MTRHRMRLVERLIEDDSGDFIVEAPTPALAAAILLAAHDRAREQCSSVVTLPDGLAETQSVCRWSRRIEPTNVVENSVFCMLLDEAGQEIEEIDPEWEGTTADEQQRNAQGICGQEQAGTAEPGP